MQGSTEPKSTCDPTGFKIRFLTEISNVRNLPRVMSPKGVKHREVESLAEDNSLGVSCCRKWRVEDLPGIQIKAEELERSVERDEYLVTQEAVVEVRPDEAKKGPIIIHGREEMIFVKLATWS